MIFGKKTKDEQINYEEALTQIKQLFEDGYTPSHYVHRIPHIRKYKVKNPSQEEVFNTIETHLRPHQMEHNPELKGETTVTHQAHEHSNKRKHTFIFTKTIDNLFDKGLKGHKATFILEKKK